jgi:hypothetical protein
MILSVSSFDAGLRLADFEGTVREGANPASRLITALKESLAFVCVGISNYN